MCRYSLEDGSYVVSVSFGAARVMTFEPKHAAPAVDGANGVGMCSPDDVKAAKRAFIAALSTDAVGLYKLNPVDPKLEGAWFQPLSL